jgi:hypothetical protein
MFGGLVFLCLMLALYVCLHGAIIMHLIARRKCGGGRLLVPFALAGMATPILALALFSPWGADADEWRNFDEYRLAESPLLAFGVSWLSAFVFGLWISRSSSVRDAGRVLPAEDRASRAKG